MGGRDGNRGNSNVGIWPSSLVNILLSYAGGAVLSNTLSTCCSASAGPSIRNMVKKNMMEPAEEERRMSSDSEADSRQSLLRESRNSSRLPHRKPGDRDSRVANDCATRYASESPVLLLTDAVEARVKDVQRLPEADGQPGRLDEYRQVAADVVHDEQEDAHSSGAHIQRHDLHHNGEHYTEPHLGCEGNDTCIRLASYKRGREFHLFH